MPLADRGKQVLDLRVVLADIPERAMVRLGAPGCGKSTLLRRLQLDETRQQLADESDKLSLFVSLGAYPLDKDPARDAPRPLAWLKAQLQRQAPELLTWTRCSISAACCCCVMRSTRCRTAIGTTSASGSRSGAASCATTYRPETAPFSPAAASITANP